MNLEKLIADARTTVVDVRTPAEFAGGHVAGSVNIPLQEIPNRLDELRALSRPLVLCCASGNRSGQAEHYLKGQGFEDVHNGGSWLDVNYYATKQHA
jgi:phage shock protein E